MAVQILDKAFLILETLSRELAGLSVSALSEQMGMNISTVHRILGAFQSRGYVEQTENKRYKLSLKFIAISSSYLHSLELKTETDPFLNKLSAQLKLTVFLATLMEDQVVYIDKHEIYSSFRKYSVIGERRPLYCTALGKALLLGFTREELDLYIVRTAFESFTLRTIRDGGALREELDASRERGWTMDNEEIEEGIVCFAVPIHDYRGKIIASVSTSCFGKEIEGRKEEIVGSLLAASSRISERMGYKGDSPKQTSDNVETQRRHNEKYNRPL